MPKPPPEGPVDLFRPREEAEEELAELEETLRLIPIRAFERYHDKQREERADFRLRTQADIVHAYMEKEARDRLRTVWYVVLARPTLQAFYFDVWGKWRFRLHKLNDDFTIENNRTALGLEFIHQDDPQMPLGLDLPKLTNLHLGYRLNSAKSGLASVHIVCPKSEEEVSWQYIPPDRGTEGPGPGQPVHPEGPRPRLRPGELPAETPKRTGESAA